jgi:Uma2 family endonuclease
MAMAVQKRRFTTADYDRMGETGILSERDRVELIDGEVVAMTPIGSRHNGAVNRAAHALFSVIGDRAILQVQGPVRLGGYDEPEPDLALLHPRPDYYASAHAGPQDILLIVEIAESSVEYDLAVKSRLYAGAGVREYWVADLATGRLICHSDPEGGAYTTRVERQPGETVAPQGLPTCALPVESFFAG